MRFKTGQASFIFSWGDIPCCEFRNQDISPRVTLAMANSAFGKLLRISGLLDIGTVNKNHSRK